MTATPGAVATPATTEPFTIERIELLTGSMRLRRPFRTSFGAVHDRPLLLARVTCDGVAGYGESAATHEPLYSEETIGTSVLMIRAHLGPAVLGRTFAHPRDVGEAWQHVKGNPMAKAVVEQAVWDAVARRDGVSLSTLLGGDRTRVPSGVSIGIPDSLEELLDSVDAFVAQGYARIKIKIKPGWDVDVMTAVRTRHPDTDLMADANAAYRVDDGPHLAALDDLGLTMIEQPLDHDDLVDHATLARALATPVCLDESIRTAADVRRMHEIGAGRIVNVKVGRLGGHAAVLDVQRVAGRLAVPLWCGGMLESGIGRLHNIAIASLPGFTMPGDTSASDRYWEADIIDPPVTLDADGTVAVPDGPGIGHAIDTDRLDAVVDDRLEIRGDPRR